MTDADVIHDRYVLGERLGIGGMSTVVLAFDRTLERNVAVKLLAEHLADDAQFVSRFRREALSAARLVHPNIVQVFDFGIDEPTGRQFIVMEYVRGRSGAELLREHGALPLPQAMSILVQACKGLAYAHRNGVIHRDVKPGNLLRAQEGGVVKLADFGIAKALADESSITQVGSVLGTAAYLSPEQASGTEAGPRADLYSLGVVAYQLLTGRLPYEANSLTELALKQQREAPALASDLDANIPLELAQAIDRALALDPRARYADADEMSEALQDGARGIAIDAPPAFADPLTTATTIGAPDTAATTIGAPGTGATSVVPGAADARVERRVPRAPRYPPPAPAPAPAPSGASARSAARRDPPGLKKRSGARRFIGVMLVFLLLSAGAVAAVVATSSSQQVIKLRQVVYKDVNQTLDSMQQLVKDNTQ